MTFNSTHAQELTRLAREPISMTGELVFDFLEIIKVHARMGANEFDLTVPFHVENDKAFRKLENLGFNVVYPSAESGYAHKISW